jgi:hypothetical protein
MDRSMNAESTFLNLFDIVATTAMGIAAPIIGADDIDDSGTDPGDGGEDPA